MPRSAADEPSTPRSLAGAGELMAPANPLWRSSRYRVLGGVCGGIAEWLGWSPGLVRFLYVVLSIVSAGFPGTLVYIVLWIVLPSVPHQRSR